MKYFIVNLKYLVPVEQLADHVAAHRAHLDSGYSQGWFLASGPQNPKVGGIIIARAPSREYLEKLFEKDPFKVKQLAEYQIVEFEPVKRHPEMAAFFIS